MNILYLVTIISAIELSGGSHVLIIHDVGTKSHLIQLFPVVEGLLENGHQVTGVFFSSSKIVHPNFTEVLVPNNFDKIMGDVSKLYMEKGGQSMFNLKLYQFVYDKLIELMDEYAVTSIKNEKIQELATTGKFDVTISMPWMGPGILLSEMTDTPLITFSPAGPLPIFMEGSGNVINLSVQPLITGRYIEPMTLKERLMNHVMNVMTNTYMNWLNGRIHAVRVREVDPNLPISDEIMKKRLTVFLSSSHPVTHGAWQYGPNVIEVGGLNVKKAKPLPDDLKKWMDEANNGVILVSFGSTLNPSSMSSEKLELLLGVFRSLKQYSFIWKWDTETEIPNLPNNVKIMSWLPQQDLLAHPNLRVFVTHGGIGSLTEAIYHKAALVGIPFSNDQRPNLLRAVKLGFAVLLDWDQLTVDSLMEAVVGAMESEDMVASLDRVHRLYTDREKTPVEKAVWWIEYVARNGIEGCKMMKPIAEHIPWIQYHHLDVLFIFVTVIVIIISIFVSLCYCCVKKCCCRQQKPKKD